MGFFNSLFGSKKRTNVEPFFPADLTPPETEEEQGLTQRHQDTEEFLVVWGRPFVGRW